MPLDNLLPVIGNWVRNVRVVTCTNVNRPREGGGGAGRGGGRQIDVGLLLYYLWTHANAIQVTQLTARMQSILFCPT